MYKRPLGNRLHSPCNSIFRKKEKRNRNKQEIANYTPAFFFNVFIIFVEETINTNIFI